MDFMLLLEQPCVSWHPQLVDMIRVELSSRIWL
jgi:hypothetical protein